MLFGASVASLVFGTFVTYVLIVFHLAPRPSQFALLASIAWALLVSAFIGIALAADLPTVMTLISSRAFTVPRFVGPVDTLASYLFVSYFLLFAAYLDAHRTVARGPSPETGSNSGGPPAGPLGGGRVGGDGDPAHRLGEGSHRDER